MATCFQHLARRTAAPAAACLLSASVSLTGAGTSLCEAPRPKAQDAEAPTGTPPPAPVPEASSSAPSGGGTARVSKGVSVQHFQAYHSRSPPPPPRSGQEGIDTESADDAELYHGLFPTRQLFHPTMEYPLWNYNWDGRRPNSTGDPAADKKRDRHIRKTGITRHVILVRHGQYDETHKEDEMRILTPLGREQADLTGRRLAEMIRGIDEEFGPCDVKVVRVSDMARAKETAEIISAHLPNSVERTEPDPDLNEGRPCHHIPGVRASESTIAKTDEGHSRIERAFKRYFHRADRPQSQEDDDSGESDAATANEELKPHPKHEFEIIVCHGNVIRYMTCRALQIPPEAWLRLCTFNCSLTYLTIRPTGSVSCRMLGDIGHLGLANSTFSGHHGFNW